MRDAACVAPPLRGTISSPQNTAVVDGIDRGLEPQPAPRAKTLVSTSARPARRASQAGSGDAQGVSAEQPPGRSAGGRWEGPIMKSAIDSNNMRGTAMNMRDSGRAWSVTAALLVLFCSGNGAKGQTQPPAQSIPYAQNFGTATFGTMPTGWALWANSGSANQSQTLAEAINPAADTTVTNAVFAAQTSGGAYGDLQSGNARLVVLVSSNATNGAVVPVLSLNTTGQSNLTLTYSMTVARVAASVSANAVTQYRIGNSGSYNYFGHK